MAVGEALWVEVAVVVGGVVTAVGGGSLDCVAESLMQHVAFSAPS